MKNFKNKSLALLVCVSVIGSFAGCGKDTSTEESLQAEIDALRAQLETQETAADQADETEGAEETEAEETQAVEETAQTEADIEYPFTVNKTRTNLTVGEIAEYEDFCVGLAGVRMFDEYESMLEGTYYSYDIPTVPDGQVAVTPILQIYNTTGSVQEYDDQLISLYADNVQVTRVEPNHNDSYWVDGLQELVYTDIDAGESSVIVSAFNVDENWSSLTVFYGDISWTVSREEVMADPYTYTSMFNQGTVEVTEPGTTIYQNTEYQLIFDGAQIYTQNLRIPYVMFEYTINNTTDSMIQIEIPSHMRVYYEHRLLSGTNSVIDDTVDGYSNAHTSWGTSVIEIHPGMTSKIFVSCSTYEQTGTFTCYFETENEGVVAVVSSAL